jgi:hypothetical protein
VREKCGIFQRSAADGKREHLRHRSLRQRGARRHRLRRPTCANPKNKESVRVFSASPGYPPRLCGGLARRGCRLAGWALSWADTRGHMRGSPWEARRWRPGCSRRGWESAARRTGGGVPVSSLPRVVWSQRACATDQVRRPSPASGCACCKPRLLIAGSGPKDAPTAARVNPGHATVRAPPRLEPPPAPWRLRTGEAGCCLGLAGAKDVEPQEDGTLRNPARRRPVRNFGNAGARNADSVSARPSHQDASKRAWQAALSMPHCQALQVRGEAVATHGRSTEPS